MTELRSIPSLRESLAPPPSAPAWKERLCAAARTTPQSPRLGVSAWLLWSAPGRWAPTLAFALTVLWTGGLLGLLSMSEEQFLRPATQVEAVQLEERVGGDGAAEFEEAYFTLGEDLLEHFENAVLEEEGVRDEFQDWAWYADF